MKTEPAIVFAGEREREERIFDVRRVFARRKFWTAGLAFFAVRSFEVRDENEVKMRWMF